MPKVEELQHDPTATMIVALSVLHVDQQMLASSETLQTEGQLPNWSC